MAASVGCDLILEQIEGHENIRRTIMQKDHDLLIPGRVSLSDGYGPSLIAISLHHTDL